MCQGILDFYNACFRELHNLNKISFLNENLPFLKKIPFDYLKLVVKSDVHVFKHVLYETLTC